jgi:uncharacterized protein (TIGR03492 family)
MTPTKLLCLSNGHGEDEVAVRILRELQQYARCPELAALPLVGEGHAYRKLPEVPIVGPVQRMPSGGFIYQDGRQLWRDVRGGLIGLTLAQCRTVKRWVHTGGCVLAVGDIVPLLLAWWSGALYGFVGTARTEYYLRDEIDWLPRRRWFERLENWSGSVYLPWERWLMRYARCKAVFPRDSLTATTLQRYGIRAFDLGNPMMDELGIAASNEPIEMLETHRALCVVLLPGSRSPEVYANWQQITIAVTQVREAFADQALVFLVPLAAGVEIEPLQRDLSRYGWRSQPTQTYLKTDPEALQFGQHRQILVFSRSGFAECLRRADVAIAMAGTATEQFVGLGKPAIAFPGAGPQFTPGFAEAQSRHLGHSLLLVERPEAVTKVLQAVLTDPDRLQAIAENGRRRMGEPGAARRIADRLMGEVWD